MRPARRMRNGAPGERCCHALFRQRPHDPNAPYDAYMEDEDTEEAARSSFLPAVTPVVSHDDPSFWNRFAFAYDLVTGAGEEGLDEAAAYIVTFLDRHDVVLDAACGTGAFTCRIAPLVGFVGACDFAQNMVSRTQRLVTRDGLDNVAVGLGNICTLDFADDTFDAAIAGNVLHLLREPERALDELKRVVRQGGIIALPTCINAEDTDRRFLSLIEAAGFSTQHEWDEGGYLAFLADIGMDVISHRRFDAKQPLCVAICRV